MSETTDQPKGPRWNSGYSVGPIEAFLGRAFEMVFVVIANVCLAAVLLILLVGAIYWVTGQVIVPGVKVALDFLGRFPFPGIGELISAVVYGGIFGTFLGFLRYRFGIKERLDKALESFGSYETVSKAPFGLSHVIAFAVAGAASEVMVSWLGASFQSVLTSEVLAHPTPLVAIVVGGGSGGGGGDFDWIGLIWLVLAAIILSLVACAVSYVGLSKLAYEVSTGAVGTVAKAFGVGLGLALARGVPRIRDPGPPRGPLTLDNAIPALFMWVGDIPGAHDQVESYFRWSREQGVDPLKASEAKRYASSVLLPANNAIKFLPDILDWASKRNNLFPELNPTDPSPPLPSRQRVLDDLYKEVFAKGWIARTIASGAIVGSILGGLQALIAGILLALTKVR